MELFFKIFMIYQLYIHAYIHCLQVAIMTPKVGSWDYPYNFIKISPHR